MEQNEERITPKLLDECARELADSLLDSAARGTQIQMNNQIDILRSAAIIILGVDLANSIHSFNFTSQDVGKHLQMLVTAINEESNLMLKTIKSGQSEHRIPHQQQ